MLSPKVRTLAKWLRRKFPGRRPLQIRECKKLTDCHGICFIHKNKVLIRLRAQDSDVLQSETLLEEYAHYLRDECPVPCEDDHDHIFWGILAYITKKYRGE